MYCNVTQHVEQSNQGQGVSHTFEVLMECDYIAKVEGLAQQHGGFYHTHRDVVLVCKADEYLGGLYQLMDHLQQTYDYTPMVNLTDSKFMVRLRLSIFAEALETRLLGVACTLQGGIGGINGG